MWVVDIRVCVFVGCVVTLHCGVVMVAEMAVPRVTMEGSVGCNGSSGADAWRRGNVGGSVMALGSWSSGNRERWREYMVAGLMAAVVLMAVVVVVVVVVVMACWVVVAVRRSAVGCVNGGSGRWWWLVVDGSVVLAAGDDGRCGCRVVMVVVVVNGYLSDNW